MGPQVPWAPTIALPTPPLRRYCLQAMPSCGACLGVIVIMVLWPRHGMCDMVLLAGHGGIVGTVVVHKPSFTTWSPPWSSSSLPDFLGVVQELVATSGHQLPRWFEELRATIPIIGVVALASLDGL
jgi:hypothetical protein